MLYIPGLKCLFSNIIDFEIYLYKYKLVVNFAFNRNVNVQYVHYSRIHLSTNLQGIQIWQISHGFHVHRYKISNVKSMALLVDKSRAVTLNSVSPK